jgi:NitT/TauT family transport system ATP-binding protein
MCMLEIKNLFVKYKNSKHPAVQDVSFDIGRGQRLAILGPSGCGKSTTLNVIAELLTRQEAEIKGGIKWNDKNKKPIVRMVFQEATLLPWRTVERNVAYGLEIQKIPKEEITEKVGKVLKAVGLLESAKSYPHHLSVGMRQRVNFARALICEPDLILLDEPFSALDIETKKTVQREFLKIIKEKGMASILVTHNMSEAVTMADKIIVLSKRPSVIVYETKETIDERSLIEGVSPVAEYLEIYE